MDGGALNLTVELWRDGGATQGDYGEHLEGWTLLESRSARIDAGRGTERYAVETERAEQTAKITMRYDSLTRTLTTRDRLRYVQDVVSVEYDIIEVADRVGRHDWIVVTAVARSPEAARLP